MDERQAAEQEHRLMARDEKEQLYREHVRREGREQWNDHPDGCFFCGGNHHSSECNDAEAVQEWEDF